MDKEYGLSPSQKEQARHGERMFPLKRYVTVLSDLCPSVPAHWHEEAELTMILEGSCTYHIHLEIYEADAGDILFIPPAELHSITVDPENKMTSATYVFHMDYLDTNSGDICAVKYLNPISRHALVLPYIIKKEHPAYTKMHRIFCEMEQTHTAQAPGYEMTLKALLLYAAAVLIPYRQAEGTRPQLEDEHTAKQLAKLCFFSEYHFMRFFKKYTGMSCLEYIKNLRLEKAASRLAQGGQSVLEVSLSCGFANLSYFYREFRKKYGMTPKQFIKEVPMLPFLPEQMYSAGSVSPRSGSRLSSTDISS